MIVCILEDVGRNWLLKFNFNRINDRNNREYSAVYVVIDAHIVHNILFLFDIDLTLIILSKIEALELDRNSSFVGIADAVRVYETLVNFILTPNHLFGELVHIFQV